MQSQMLLALGQQCTDCSLVIKTLTRLLLLLGQALSPIALFSQSISEFKEGMKHYGYANNMVLPNSKHHHFGNPDMFVSAPVHAFRVLMNKNASPLPRKNREKSYKYLLSNLQLCEALGLELYNIKYHPSFFLFFFIRLIFMPKAQTRYIIKFLTEDLLLSSRKVSTKRIQPLEQ